MDKKTLSFLGIIVLLAGALRFSYLDYNPPSLNWDEISHGYNAYSVLKTGMDQWGTKFPLANFRAYGDYPTTLNLYLTIPFIMIFGLTELGIRFPHALFGILTVVASFFLTWGLTKKKNLSLLAACLVAVGPWYIFTSRFVLQANLSVFLLASSGAFFFNRDKNKYFFPTSFLLLFLSLFSYHSTRILAPLVLLGGLLIYLPKSWKVYLATLLFITFSVALFLNPESRARSGLLFIVDQGAVNRIIEKRITSNLPPTITRLVYNRPIYFVGNFIKNYMEYFSPKFLFLEGGTQYQFSIPKKGLVLPILLPFFYFGLIILILKALRDKDFRYILFLVLISPIPAAITNEKFAVVRAMTMLPLVEVVSVIGLAETLKKINKKYLMYFYGGFGVLGYIFLESYLLTYFTTYRASYSWSWQYGYKEVVSFIKEKYSNYDKILVTKKYGEPHEYILFYMKWDPGKYINDPNAIRFSQSGWYWVDRFDKFYFINDWQIKDLVTESKIDVGCKKEKCLLVSSPGNYPDGWKKIEIINFLDGSPAFEIYEN